MSRELPPSGVPAPGRRHLPTPWFIALGFGLCVVMAVISATVKNVGRELGGPTGEVIGVGLGFIAVCALSAVLTRLFANPLIPVLSGLFVGMSAAGVAQAAGLDDSETWRAVLRFVVFFAAYLFWAGVVVPLLVPRAAAPASGRA